MTRLPVALAVLLALSLTLTMDPRPAAAQALVMPDQPLDAERAALRDAIYQLRDSLNAVVMAGGRLQRDIRQTSNAAVTSRARVVQAACAAASRALQQARRTVTAQEPTESNRAKQRGELLTAFKQLAPALTRCEKEFGDMGAPGQGERARGYGPDRANQVRAAIREYDQFADAYLTAYGIPHLPKGKVRLSS